MPAALPGSTKVQNAANPSLGQFVIFDSLSGPKGSPLDKDNTGNASTGALSSGIGYGGNHIIGPISNPLVSNSVYGIRKAGFDDDEVPGVTLPNNTAAADSRLRYIGGGKSSIVSGTGPNGNGAPTSWKVSVPVPYTAGFGILGAGNGGSRDAGAGPAFTGFEEKMVTAVGTVANGAAIEACFINRSGVDILIDQSAFGSAAAASAAPA